MQPNESNPLNQLLKIILPELEADFPEIEHEFILSENSGKKSVKKILEELIDKINSNTKVNPNLNFFPSDPKGTCQKIAFGVATKKFGHNCDKLKYRTGFEGLIKSIVSCWLKCSEVNESTIIITMDWDDTSFQKDWIEIIEAYKSKGKKIEIFQIFERNRTYSLIYS